MNDEFATKNDLQREAALLRHELRLECAQLRHEMKEEFANVRHEIKELEISLRGEMANLGDKLTIRLGAMMTAGLALIFGMLQLMK